MTPTRESCMAADYVSQGIAAYEYERHITESKVCLYLYQKKGWQRYLDDAIKNTKIAIHIHRLTKH
jgi:hypothetical protein